MNQASELPPESLMGKPTSSSVSQLFRELIQSSIRLYVCCPFQNDRYFLSLLPGGISRPFSLVDVIIPKLILSGANQRPHRPQNFAHCFCNNYFPVSWFQKSSKYCAGRKKELLSYCGIHIIIAVLSSLTLVATAKYEVATAQLMAITGSPWNLLALMIIKQHYS